MITAEPAVVLPCENDEDIDIEEGSIFNESRRNSTQSHGILDPNKNQVIFPQHQPGTMLRRASASIAPGAAHLLSPSLASPRIYSPQRRVRPIGSPSVVAPGTTGLPESLPNSPIL
jgi:hypothetical protein